MLEGVPRQNADPCSHVPVDRRDAMGAEFFPTFAGAVQPPAKRQMHTRIDASQPMSSNIVMKTLLFCFIANAMSFRVVEDPYFTDYTTAVYLAAKADVPIESLRFSRKQLTARLDANDADLRAVTDTELAAAAPKGITLMFDGAQDRSRRPLINMVACTTTGTFLLETVDASGEQKSAIYLATLLMRAIARCGAQNVTAIASDGAANCILAITIATRPPAHRHIKRIPCYAHAMDLALSKIGALSFCKTAAEKATLIVQQVMNHHLPCALFRKIAKELHVPKVIMRVCPTRFATLPLCLSTMLRQRVALTRTVTDPKWAAWYAGTNELFCCFSGCLLVIWRDVAFCSHSMLHYGTRNIHMHNYCLH